MLAARSGMELGIPHRLTQQLLQQQVLECTWVSHGLADEEVSQFARLGVVDDQRVALQNARHGRGFHLSKLRRSLNRLLRCKRKQTMTSLEHILV